jgi:hypothetical protein
MEWAFERVSHRAVKAAFLCAALVWGYEVRLLQACKRNLLGLENRSSCRCQE